MMKYHMLSGISIKTRILIASTCVVNSTVSSKQHHRKRTRKTRHTYLKENLNLHPFAVGILLYAGNPKEYIK